LAHSEYLVRQGDCISSIASKHGLFWETVWNDAKNGKLKNERKDPNVLLPGDIVYVPNKELKQQPISSNQKHRFRKKGVPAKLRLRLMQEPEPPGATVADEDGDEAQAPESTPQEDEPRANVPYILEIEGVQVEGKTDSQGYIEHSMPPDAKVGKLIVEPATPNEIVIPLKLGTLNPISEITGVKQRLNNLGFDCGDKDDSITAGFKAALKVFQENHSLDMTGELDQATRDKVREVHGS